MCLFAIIVLNTVTVTLHPLSIFIISINKRISLGMSMSFHEVAHLTLTVAVAPTTLSKALDEETGSVPLRSSTRRREKQGQRRSRFIACAVVSDMWLETFTICCRRRSSVGPEPTEMDEFVGIYCSSLCVACRCD